MPEEQKIRVRRAEFAGQFYPGQAAALKNEVNAFLDKAKTSLDAKVSGLIVPHAGYPYSGAVAAEAYKTVQGRSFEAVVVIAFLHRAFLQGVFVDDGDSFETPLGQVAIHRRLAGQIRESDPVLSEEVKGSVADHSMEVQIPFLQTAVKGARIVPVYIGEQSLENAEALGDALGRLLLGREVLVVASTDLSHFHPYEEAVRKDRETIRLIEKGDVKKLVLASQSGEAEACGLGTVISMIIMAEKLGWSKPSLLRYANSGDVTRDRRSVVGYAAMALKEQS